MKQLLLTLLMSFPLLSWSQTFSIHAKDKHSYNQIEEKVKDLGYSIVDSNAADYKLALNVWVTSKFNSMYKGHLILKDKKGKEIARTKDIRRGAVAVNGFNASYNIAKVISEKELAGLLRNIKPKD